MIVSGYFSRATTASGEAALTYQVPTAVMRLRRWIQNIVACAELHAISYIRAT